jgi:hypothetical protein
MVAFRAQSSAWGKGTLVPAATFDACKLLISKKKRNRQEINHFHVKIMYIFDEWILG